MATRCMATPLTWQSSTSNTVSGILTPCSSQSCVMPAFTAMQPTRFDKSDISLGTGGGGTNSGMIGCSA